MDTAEILRLISNIFRVGYVEEIDYDERKVRVRTGGNFTNWISWQVQRAGTTKTWDPPTSGEQVMLACPEGELNSAIVLMSLYSADHDAPSASPNKHIREYPDGAVIEYDHASGALAATGIKTARLQAEVLTEVDCPLTVFKGKVVVEDLFTYMAGMSGTNGKGNKTTIAGDINHKGDYDHSEGEMKSNGVVVDKHEHGGVQKGDENTNGPNK